MGHALKCSAMNAMNARLAGHRKVWQVLLAVLSLYLSFAPANVVGIKAPLFRLSRCKEQLPQTVDVSSVRRKFIRLHQEDFQDEAPKVTEERASRRQKFETVEEFCFLFAENDKDLEKSGDRTLWAMHEQALVEAMEDGSIFWQPRITGDLSWKRLREKEPETLERWETSD
ncbi:unnamed protein product [Cladocopium goreaui]|uniref:Pyridoxal 5'-phosphate synthase (Glutamine hydrolyzing) n=1 Tax=Cladocopium goreaui TaxID=2562237 RepID=A0A9P1CCB9_9DINO|nr:unnamed protein product [Cladocopium goreaui]